MNKINPIYFGCLMAVALDAAILKIKNNLPGETTVTVRYDGKSKSLTIPGGKSQRINTPIAKSIKSIEWLKLETQSFEGHVEGRNFSFASTPAVTMTHANTWSVNSLGAAGKSLGFLTIWPQGNYELIPGSKGKAERVKSEVVKQEDLELIRV